jgi:hypothetical protein
VVEGLCREGDDRGGGLVGIAENILGGNAEHSETTLTQESVAHGVTCDDAWLVMDLPVDLNHELRRRAVESAL